MSLFQKGVKAAPAYLKMGIYGDPASGKTWTASLTAIGLAKMIKPQPPVFFIDTETGSDWVGGLFEKAGIELLPVKTRSFADLKQAVVEAQDAHAILIADSMSHFWEEIRTSFLAAKRERLHNDAVRLELPDWNIIKPAWAEFTTLYLNSSVHIILCGRAASIYDFQEREGDGRKEMITVGTRMAAEKGMGYEPSLLVEMTQRQVVARKNKSKTLTHVATVLKDRSDVLDGLQFVDPTFDSFLPHIQRLNLGGAHTGVDTSRTSKAMFPSEGESNDPRAARRRVKLGAIQDLLVLHVPGQTAAEKQKRILLLRKHFEAGWTEMDELMSLEKLSAGYITLKRELEPEATAAVTEASIDDEIPHAEPKAAAPLPEGQPEKLRVRVVAGARS